jgi:hypothetical protein
VLDGFNAWKPWALGTKFAMVECFYGWGTATVKIVYHGTKADVAAAMAAAAVFNITGGSGTPKEMTWSAFLVQVRACVGREGGGAGRRGARRGGGEKQGFGLLLATPPSLPASDGASATPVQLPASRSCRRSLEPGLRCACPGLLPPRESSPPRSACPAAAGSATLLPPARASPGARHQRHRWRCSPPPLPLTIAPPPSPS